MTMPYFTGTDDRPAVVIWEQLTQQGVVEPVKAIIKTLYEAKLFADANDLAAVFAALEPGSPIPDSNLKLTRERGLATLGMVDWFLTQIQTPLPELGLSPQDVLFRVWPRAVTPTAGSGETTV